MPDSITPAEAQTPPAEPKVVTPFDEGQKARINEIVKEASARAGAEARAEVARLKATLPQEPQTDALLRLATAEAEVASLRENAAEVQVREVLRKATSSQNYYDQELACQLLRSSIRIVDGKPVVVDAQGTPRLAPDFSPMTPAQLSVELSEAKKFLTKSSFVGGGVGSVANANPSHANTIPLDKLFGPHSDGGAAQRLALRNPAGYKAARAQAVAAGLLPR